MSKRLSVEEAWGHVLALWPDAECIVRHDGKEYPCYKDAGIAKRCMNSFRIEPGIIDWPEGMTRFPDSTLTND